MTSRVRIFLLRTRDRETLPSATSLFVCSNHSSVTLAAAMSNPAWEHRAMIVRHNHSCGEHDAKPVMWQSTSSPVCAVDGPPKSGLGQSLECCPSLMLSPSCDFRDFCTRWLGNSYIKAATPSLPRSRNNSSRLTHPQIF